MRTEQRREFQLSITGEVESGRFPPCFGVALVSYSIDSDNKRDWSFLTGCRACRSQPSVSISNEIVWNLPISCIFSSSTPTGWPSIVISLQTIDRRGKAVSFGSSTVLVPSQPGRHKREAHVLAPCSMSWWNIASGWFLGRRSIFAPHEKASGFHDIGLSGAIVSACSATVILNLNVIIKGHEKLNLLFYYLVLRFYLELSSLDKYANL